MKTTEQTPTERLTAAARSLGLTLENSGPAPGIRDGLPCISYQCRLLRDGREVWAGPYRLGVGHVKIPKHVPPMVARRLTSEQKSVLFALQNGKRLLKDAKVPMWHAELAAKLAAAQKVEPNLPDVLHGLLMDGQAHLQHQTFEDWCAELGYDTDSRKAEEIYRACDTIGRAFGRAFTAKELQTLQDAAQDY